MRALLFMPLLSLCSAALLAQLPPQSLWVGGHAIAGPVGQRGAVRDGGGNLLCMVIDRGGGSQDALTILRSTDGGQTWSNFLAPVNDATSGLTGSNRANQAVMAVDDQDRLHVSWQRAHYPSDYEQFYRNIDLTTGSMSPIVNVNTLLSIPLTSRSNAQAIQVGPAGYVWMTGPTTSNWREQLLRSTQPYGAGGGFISVGGVSPANQAQNSRLAFDATGVLHAIYYALPYIKHRSYDPATSTWSLVSNVAAHGGGSMARAFDLRADLLGGVHAIAMVNTTASGTSINPELQYARWDAAGGWVGGDVVASWTQAQITASNGSLNNMRTAGLAVNEATGDVFVVMRDFGAAAGSLVIVRKATGESAFHLTRTLTAPSQLRDDYHAPFFIGAENPATGLTLSDLQVFWRQGATGTQFSAWHAQHPGTPLAAAVTLGAGCAGTSGSPLVIDAPPPILGSTAWAASISGGPPGGLASIFATPQPGPAPLALGAGCTIYLDLSLVSVSNPLLGPLPLDATGSLTIPYSVPGTPGTAGSRITAQVAVSDPGGTPFGLVLSNGLDLFFGW